MVPLITCRNADSCKAPLCPLDTTKSDSRQVWYPDEPICSAREYQSIYWIENQRQIVGTAGSKRGFFTLRMLKATKAVKKGVLGIDPDSLPSERKRLAEPDRPPKRSSLSRRGGRRRPGSRSGKASKPSKGHGREVPSTESDSLAPQPTDLKRGKRQRPKPLRPLVRTPRLDRHPRKVIASKKAL